MLIVDSILANGHIGGDMRLFLNDVFEDVETKIQYSITKFHFGRYNMLDLNNNLYGIIKIQDNNMVVLDNISDDILTLRRIKSAL